LRNGKQADEKESEGRGGGQSLSSTHHSANQFKLNMAKDRSHKKNKSLSTTLDNPTTLPVPSPSSTKKRSLDTAQLDDEDLGEKADGEQQEELDEDAAAKAASKLEKGKSKKRRKEEERALVRSSYCTVPPWKTYS
jgi:hypothetical protein